MQDSGLVFYIPVCKHTNRILILCKPEEGDKRYIICAYNLSDSSIPHTFHSIAVCTRLADAQKWINEGIAGIYSKEFAYALSKYKRYQFKFEDLIVVRFADTRALSTVEL